MNEPLLRQVQAMILRYPAHVDMHVWVLGGTLTADKHAGPPCGTTGGIAGWARALADGAVCPLVDSPTEAAEYEFERHAKNLLNLTYHESKRLFFVWLWPAPFAFLYWATQKWPTQRARVIAWRIEKFIESGGVE